MRTRVSFTYVLEVSTSCQTNIHVSTSKINYNTLFYKLATCICTCALYGETHQLKAIHIHTCGILIKKKENLLEQKQKKKGIATKVG